MLLCLSKHAAPPGHAALLKHVVILAMLLFLKILPSLVMLLFLSMLFPLVMMLCLSMMLALTMLLFNNNNNNNLASLGSNRTIKTFKLIAHFNLTPKGGDGLEGFKFVTFYQ
jgi:hypothetical protein